MWLDLSCDDYENILELLLLILRKEVASIFLVTLRSNINGGDVPCNMIFFHKTFCLLYFVKRHFNLQRGSRGKASCACVKNVEFGGGDPANIYLFKVNN